MYDFAVLEARTFSAGNAMWCAHSRRRPCARDPLRRPVLLKSVHRIAAPFIAFAIWRLLPSTLIPSDGDADEGPEGRDARITDQVVDDASGPDHDRKINS
jgi:hypothetical protein